jgi:phenylacetate-CoA ligase
MTSSGSTGERGVFVYDWEGWATFWVSAFRYLLRCIRSDPELRSRPVVLGWVAAAHFTDATAALSRTFASPGIVNVRFPVTLQTDEIVAGLNEAQPDLLLAYPSALHVLSLEARARRLRIAPRQVWSCAEPLLPEIRAAAEQAWGVHLGNLWGASEGGGVAVGCDLGRSHLSDDLVIVEPVDEDGLPVAPGERSAKVYLTNLFNRALPLIRYEITDEVMILTDSCPCGSAHRCVADIQGRLDDVFFYDGLRVHPHVFRSVLGRQTGVAEYQVRQRPQGASIAVHCGARVDLEGLRAEITHALARLGLPSPVVDVAAVARLERDPGPARLRRFVPLADPPYREAVDRDAARVQSVAV